MKVTPCELPEVLLIESVVHRDERGFFLESYNQREFDARIPGAWRFAQDNHSMSRRGVLRGLHYQLVRPQGKLVRCLFGEVIDVVVDVRRSSPRFGRWMSLRQTGDASEQLWIPPGFAHGFRVLSERADIFYKTTEFWYPQHERAIRWSDPELAIDWELDGEPCVAARDASAPWFRDAEVFD